MPFFIVEPSLRPPRRTSMARAGPATNSKLYHGLGFYGSDGVGAVSRPDRDWSAAGTIVGCSVAGRSCVTGAEDVDAAGAPVAPSRKKVGSRAIPLRRTSKKRCGPVLHPVVPIRPTTWPLATCWPTE